MNGTFFYLAKLTSTASPAGDVATLNAEGKVIQLPAVASQTPGPNKIPISDENSELNGWIRILDGGDVAEGM